MSCVVLSRADLEKANTEAKEWRRAGDRSGTKVAPQIITIILRSAKRGISK